MNESFIVYALLFYRFCFVQFVAQERKKLAQTDRNFGFAAIKKTVRLHVQSIKQNKSYGNNTRSFAKCLSLFQKLFLFSSLHFIRGSVACFLLISNYMKWYIQSIRTQSAKWIEMRIRVTITAAFSALFLVILSVSAFILVSLSLLTCKNSCEFRLIENYRR